jgi:molybdenum cofactor cytidylyltransferase
MKVAVIILAAGASSRMGTSKQRLPWKSGTLLTHAINTAKKSGLNDITVVLGADEDENRQALKDENVIILSNSKWESGMGSSLKAGLKNAMQSKPDAILVMVCDQPFVTPEHLRALTNVLSTQKKKATFSKYAETTGVPAVFSKDLFSALLSLGDDQGAKGIVKQIKEEDFSTIELKDGEVDLDTYEQYLKHKKD